MSTGERHREPTTHPGRQVRAQGVLDGQVALIGVPHQRSEPAVSGELGTVVVGRIPVDGVNVIDPALRRTGAIERACNSRDAGPRQIRLLVC
jgi:hypothetical protein